MTTTAPAPTTPVAPPVKDRSAARSLAAAASGIVLTLLAFGASVPELPESVTADTARSYFTDNATALAIFGGSLAGSAALLVVFVAQLRSLMAAAENGRGFLADVAYGGGLLIAVWYLISGAFHSVSALDGIDGASDVTVLQYLGFMTVGDTIGSVATYAKGATMLAVGLASIRTRFLPRWLGWLSVLFAAMAIVGGLGVVENPVTPALWYGGLIGFALWPLLVGITVMVKAIKHRRTA